MKFKTHLVILLPIMIFSMNTFAQFSGSGTENNPYVITTAEELAQLATYVNASDANYNDKYYKLGNDIDLSGYQTGEGWIPIGYQDDRAFNGIFDGNSKKITGLYINSTTNRSGTGLFGFIQNSAGTIKNLGVIDANIIASTRVGAIAGWNNGCVTNCYSTGSVSSLSSYEAYAGGVVGFNSGSVSNCYSACSVSASSSGSSSVYAGGVGGFNGGSVSNCYSACSVNASSSGSSSVYAGGVVGYSNWSTVINCYSTSSVSAFSSGSSSSSYACGIVGCSNWNNVINCAALNPSINCVGNAIHSGRVAVGRIGSANGYDNNIAFNNMLNPYGNTTWNNKGTDREDGEDITVQSIMTDGTLGGRFTEENGWTIENGKLPGLFGNPVDIPEHLLRQDTPPVITTESLPNGEAGTAYRQTLIAEGTTPILWSVQSGYLPGGLTLSDEGIISGTPTTAGTFTFTIKATNSIGSDSKELTVTIAAKSGGDGTENNPYIITTAEELAQLATYVNASNVNYNDKYYKLGNDIDLSGYQTGEGWIPIGLGEVNSFKGVFDGNNKKITGLYINNITLPYPQVGLFGCIQNGTVKNLGVIDANITSSHVIGGVVVGDNYYGSISNCYSTGSVSPMVHAGGVVGFNNYGSVSNCYSSCSVHPHSESSIAGGVVGENYFGSVSNCYSIGPISTTFSGSSLSSYVGGVAGDNIGNIGIVSNCMALNPTINCTGENKHFGRITGAFSNNSALLSNNIAFTDMLNPDGNTAWNRKGANLEDGEDISVQSIMTDGTFGGRFTEENGWTIENGKLPGLFGNPVDIPEHLLRQGTPPVITTESLPNGEAGTAYRQTLIAEGTTPILWSVQSGYLPGGLTLSDEGIISGTPTTAGTFTFTIKATNSIGSDTKELTVTIAAKSGGDGTENNPYIITTAEELAQLATYINASDANYNDKYYKLGNDIDLSGYQTGEGWIPIGLDEVKSFKGVFDGNNKKITGLNINNTTLKCVGLFGYILNGTVKNLGVINVNINVICAAYSYSYTGGILGWNNGGSVLNCYSAGSISVFSDNTNSLVNTGGIAGFSSGNVSNCYSIISVKSHAELSTAGGVVGESNYGIVSNCFSTGSVNSSSSYGHNSSYAGGVVGENYYGRISNCFSTGSVNSDAQYASAGGVVGHDSNGSNVSNCAALNPSINCTGNITQFFGRIVDKISNNSTFSNNIALMYMLNPDGDTTWSNKGADRKDGEDITVQSIMTDGTLGGRFSSENGWTIENGKLPGLFDNAMDMPEHLTGNVVNMTDISDIHALKAYVKNGILYVNGLTAGKTWRIYNTLGTIVYESIATNDAETWHNTSSLQSHNVYIIQSDNKAIKVTY